VQPFKTPTMVIYWTDTKVPLSYAERMRIVQDAELISMTPSEILLQDTHTGRKVAVRGATDPHAPAIPAPKALA
jgi:hypothetical protein